MQTGVTRALHAEVQPPPVGQPRLYAAYSFAHCCQVALQRPVIEVLSSTLAEPDAMLTRPGSLKNGASRAQVAC